MSFTKPLIMCVAVMMLIACGDGYQPEIVDEAFRWKEEVNENLENAASNLEKGDLAAAKDFAEKAVALEPTNATGYRVLSYVSVQEDRPYEALMYGLRMLKYGEDARSYYLVGKVYASLDERRQATVAFRRSASLDPDSAAAWTQLGIQYALQSFYKKADECLEKALQCDPDYDDAHLEKAVLAFKSGSMEDCLEWVDRVLADTPERVGALSLRSKVCLSLGKYAESITTARKWRSVEPESDEPLFALGRALVSAGSPTEAISVLEVLRADGRADSNSLRMLSRAYLQSGDRERAMEVKNEADEMGEDSEEGSEPENLAIEAEKVLLDSNDIEGSIRLAREVIKENPQWGYPYVCLGMAYIRSASIPEGYEAFRMAEKLDPMNPVAYNNIALHLDKGDPGRARLAMAKAVVLDPSLRSTLVAAGIRDIRDLARGLPKDDAVCAASGPIDLALKGEWEPALLELRKIVAESDDNTDGTGRERFLMRVAVGGIIALLANDPEQASAWLLQVYEAPGRPGCIPFYAGVALYQRGLEREALNLWKSNGLNWDTLVFAPQGEEKPET